MSIFFPLHNSTKVSELNNCDFFRHIFPAPCPFLCDSVYANLNGNVIPSFAPSAMGWRLPVSFWRHLPSSVGEAPREVSTCSAGKGCCFAAPWQRNHQMGNHLLYSISFSAPKQLLVAGKKIWEWPPSSHNTVQTSASQQSSFPPKCLFTPSPITMNHCKPPAAAVGRRALLLATFTASQLQANTKTEPKALPMFWPSLLSGCEMWLALLQKGSNDKISRSFLQCLSCTQRHSRFFRSCHLFLTLKHFYWPATLAHHCEGPAARNKQLRKSQLLNFITSGFALKQHSHI